MPTPSPLGDELALLTRWNDGVARTLDATPASSPFLLHQQWMSHRYTELVRELPASDFAVPDRLRRFLPTREVDELAAILDEVRLIHARFVGLTRVEAALELNATDEQRDFHARSLAWAVRVAKLRLARPSPRDRGCPFRRFLRLYEEVVPVLDMLGIVEDQGGGEPRVVSCAGDLLSQAADFLTWTFFEQTWRPIVPFMVARSHHPALDGAALADIEQCSHIASIYRFGATTIWDEELPALADAWGLGPVEIEPALARLERMAADMFEMKPFLVRDFDPRGSVFALPGGRRAWFMWDVHDRVGVVNIAESEEEIQAQLDRGIGESMLVLDSRGRLACSVRPWLDIRSPMGMDAPTALALNLLVVEHLHGMLFERFDRLDLDAIVQSWAQRPEPEADDPLRAEEVIAASVVTRERRVSGAARICSGLRLNELLAVLEGQLGATSREGKGSELVLFRPGGRVTTVGRHKRNPLVSATAIRRILRALGVGLDEWLGAVG